MSTCNCEKQDPFGNCCRAKIAERRNESLVQMIDNRNTWLAELEAKYERLWDAADDFMSDLETEMGHHQEWQALSKALDENTQRTSSDSESRKASEGT